MTKHVALHMGNTHMMFHINTGKKWSHPRRHFMVCNSSPPLDYFSTTSKHRAVLRVNTETAPSSKVELFFKIAPVPFWLNLFLSVEICPVIFPQRCLSAKMSCPRLHHFAETHNLSKDNNYGCQTYGYQESLVAGAHSTELLTGQQQIALCL